jgi:hypothetical protein
MITLIEVEIISSEEVVPVRLSYISQSGNRVNRLAGKKNFYEALGLMI